MVEAKHPAEPLAASDLVPVVARGVGLDQFVPEPLVVPLAVVMREVLMA